MNTYEFHGSIRIEAETDMKAWDILEQALKGHDLHINDVELI